jgi:hypothetical protein
MKIKHFIASVVAGASLLASVGAASAATIYSGGGSAPAMPTSDISIYGASAQYTFWKTEGPLYRVAAGCTLGVSGATADGKHFIQQANCGGTTINFRVSSKASYDGPLAVDGNATHPSRDTTCSDPHQRPMIDPSTCSGGVCAAPTASNCYTVTIGASDVTVGDFKQKSTGALLGPLGGAATVRDFKSNPFTLSANTTDYCRPEAISFAFFAHNDITTTGGATISNITSSEAKMLFSGVVKNWSDLQAQSMNSLPVQLCFRHAGSGTHASMDAWMTPNALPQTAVTGGLSKIYFNDGSSDLMRCVNGSGSWTGSGAIGYADADQSLGSYPNVVRLTIDGVSPLGAQVDDYTHSFVSIQNMYASTTNAADPIYQDLCTYASQPSVIAAVNPNWSASCNMKRIKNSNFGNFVVNTTNNTTYPYSGYHNNNCN